MKRILWSSALFGAGALFGYCLNEWRTPALQLAHAHLENVPANAAASASSAAPALPAETSPVSPNTAPVLNQQQALASAAALIDRMIADRDVTHAGLEEVQRLLTESGQADRMPELRARIAAAVNRGELTAEQSGFGPRI
jgi:hypothetical protein